ncbi:glycosylphosphatidylinositol-anchored lipid protein transfer 6 [Hibiscus trionum]|uniref:Glycosylphosphatidylinositol-anchored lipid protein transfer 6 n=1 Tax=Hibiscus trionum TaxID=183268 RepID=A0A9W7J5Q1_HIBTR|nr:glycosylphosphatidylinositol-anchored lipid protein transfer 6 [Hibiscus trionum]
MESKHQSLTLSFVLLPMLLGFAISDVNQDKAECASQLAGLAPCLPYVGGQAKAPTVDCCGGLKQVLDKSEKCLCVLLKDKDDPSLGLKIDTTLAATLPSTCRAPINLTDCVSFLHLAPNSQDAKLFEQYGKLTGGHATNPAATGRPSSGSSSAAEKSEGGRVKRWVGVEMALGVSVWILVSLHQSLCV